MSTSSPGDTPANRSQRQAKGKAKKTRGISGLTSSTPFAQYDPDTHSWKTCEATLLSDSETFSPTLPPAGILRNGRLSQRPRLAHHIAGIASSSWPTPRAKLGDARNHKVWERSSDKPQNLENVVATREPSAVGGKLNPTWVEWLMGFPEGWTDLEDSETP